MASSTRTKRSQATKRPAPPSRIRHAPFLLELGVEELPATFVKPALTHLVDLAKSFFTEHRLSYASIRSLGTLRRLALIVEQLATHQTPLSSRVLGPPKSAAYDASGQPTQAARGFAQAHGVPVEALQVEETAKGWYLCVVKDDPGQPTLTILREQLPALIQRLSFPKSMRWDASRLRFARPLRWIVALHGTRPIRFTVGEVVSGALTVGHRFWRRSTRVGRQFIEINDPYAYPALMKRAGVIVDPVERESIIRAQLTQLAHRVRGHVLAKHADDLLEQAVSSVEWPQALMGRFDEVYLELPQEVLITSMKEHQGYFSLVGSDERLLPRFIAVTNVKSTKLDLIRKGHERVLAARLNDAKFFFHEDRKCRLEERVERLRGIVFHQKLGSLYEKTIRVKSLVGALTELVGRLDLKERCERAAYLAKADLTTGMVGEFPSLQGIMGREYAREEGEPEDICRALAEHYEPRGPHDPVPENPVGVLLGVADRVDTLTAFFSVGLIPSGSEDPFGLRRTAYGLVRLLCERGLAFDLARLLEQAHHILEAQGYGAENRLEVCKQVRAFVMDRLRFYAQAVRRIREDLIEAVLALGDADSFSLGDLLARMCALQEIAGEPAFDQLLVGFKRAHRIVQKERWTGADVDPSLFEHETERVLYRALDSATRQIDAALEGREYKKALLALLSLKEPIDGFFAGVLVNADDPVIRANRLSLLSAVDRLFGKIADFSRVQSTA
ncbi:MAG: glycine--tRNA ligase subunit beta [Nitrospirae bacterium]|nr:MAG: glycine--tRNA ligase subunit beta [Nitrospirota bacterium]